MDNKKAKCVFQRVEKKYLLSQNKFNLFFQNIEPFMTIDEHGLNTICNIYYDTDTYELIRNSIEKPNYKEKLRLRSYETPGENDKVFLEIKKKYDTTVFKRRISLQLKDAENYLEHGIKPDCDSQILHEIDYFISRYKPKKKLYLSYDRVAFFAKDNDELRITFDNNIRSRWNGLDLKKGNYGKELLDQDTYLMEIKTSSPQPMWLARALSNLNIYPLSFSKYGNIYKRDFMNGSLGGNNPDENNLNYQNNTLINESLNEVLLNNVF